MKHITNNDIKQAIKSDSRFRDLFPEFKSEIAEFMHNPTCPCHIPFLDKIMKCTDRLKIYFPGKEMMEPKSDYSELWQVINCSVDQLEEKLRKLPIGRKQISMARYEDQITIIINMLVAGV